MNPPPAPIDAALMWRALVVLAVLLVAVGGLVLLGRVALHQKDSTTSIVRSWLAVGLVAGLMVFCLLSLATTDSTLRSTLFGGLIASTGAATAFYFASKNSDQARQDILAASFGTVAVPDLNGKTVDEARNVMGAIALELRTDPPAVGGSSKIAGQDPLARTQVKRGSIIVVTAEQPEAN